MKLLEHNPRIDSPYSLSATLLSRFTRSFDTDPIEDRFRTIPRDQGSIEVTVFARLGMYIGVPRFIPGKVQRVSKDLLIDCILVNCTQDCSI